MKKLFLFLISFGLMFSTYAGQWRNSSGENSILGSENASDIDSASYDDVVNPLDRLNSNYQEGCKIAYLSASTITVGAGEIMLSNSAGSIRLMQQNTSATTVSWTDIEAGGSESASTTYYLWAFQATASDTDFDVTISTSSTAPSGKTYYARLGSFYNDSSSNITRDDITNDNDYYALQLGDWVSKSFNVAYQATTDGFLTAYSNSHDSVGWMKGLTDNSNPPTTVRCWSQHNPDSANGAVEDFTMPVRVGDYYKVTSDGTYVTSATLFWIPNE